MTHTIGCKGGGKLCIIAAENACASCLNHNPNPNCMCINIIHVSVVHLLNNNHNRWEIIYLVNFISNQGSKY